MIKKTSISFGLILCGFLFAAASNAQSVSPVIKKEITNLLKNHDIFCTNSDVTITVEAVKITPRKTGYIGSCKYGGGPSVLFEKTSTEFIKLIAVDTGMNGYFYQEKRLTKGYYDFSHSERSGNEVEITTYKWNGSGYVAGRPRTTRF